jgi:hypothetical protein
MAGGPGFEPRLTESESPRRVLVCARLKPLLREYQGERLTVTVVPTGYLWRETACASLLQFSPLIPKHISAIKTMRQLLARQAPAVAITRNPARWAT